MRINGDKFVRFLNITLLTETPLEEPYNYTYNILENLFRNVHEIKTKRIQTNWKYYGTSIDNLFLVIDGHENIFVDRNIVWSNFKDDIFYYKDVQIILEHYLKLKFGIIGNVRANSQVNNINI